MTEHSYLIEKFFDPNAASTVSLPPLPGYEEEVVASEPGRFVVRANMTDEAFEQLHGERVAGIRPHLRVVEPNRIASVPTPPPADAIAMVAEALNPDAIKRMIGADKAHAAGARGQRQRICVIDTGYSEQTKRELGSRIVHAESFIAGEGPLNPEDSHGDWCLQIIAFLCPDAELVVLKGLSFKTGSGPYDALVAANRRATTLRCTGVSQSLGGPASTIMDNAAVAAFDGGALVTVAAGNEQRGRPDSERVADGKSPARAGAYGKVLTIAAAQSDGLVAVFSNHGNCVGASTFGVRTIAPNVPGEWNGTSMATPIAQAGGALVMSSGKTHVAARQVLLANCRNTPEPTIEEGQGLIDLARVFAAPAPQPSPQPSPPPAGLPTLSKWRVGQTKSSALPGHFLMTDKEYVFDVERLKP